jgi:hypothetical protein
MFQWAQFNNRLIFLYSYLSVQKLLIVSLVAFVVCDRISMRSRPAGLPNQIIKRTDDVRFLQL